MKFFYLATLALLAGLLSVAPADANGIGTTGFNYSGSGCPTTGNGNVGSFFSADGSVYTLIFDAFLVRAVAGSADTNTVACNVTLALNYTAGFRGAVITQIYRGYVGLAPNVTGSLSVCYYFAGLPLPVTNFGASFTGPISEDYSQSFNVTLSPLALSPSGGKTTFSIITTLLISNVDNPAGGGQITEDSQDGVLTST